MANQFCQSICLNNNCGFFIDICSVLLASTSSFGRFRFTGIRGEEILAHSKKSGLKVHLIKLRFRKHIKCPFFVQIIFFLGARRLSTPQEHVHSLRGAVGKVGVAGPAGARTCNPWHREASRCFFFTSAALCAKTWVLPMELGGSWCYRGPLTGPWWYQPGPQPHVNPPNLGSQTLRLQRGAAPFTYSWIRMQQLGQIMSTYQICDIARRTFRNIEASLSLARRSWTT